MKRIIVFSLLLIVAITSFAQQDSSYVHQELDNLMSKKYNASIEMGASFGSGYWGERFVSTYASGQFDYMLKKDLNLRLGILTGDTWLYNNRDEEDKAPYENKYKRNAAYIGIDYAFNSRLILSVTAFMDNMSGNNMYSNFGSRNLYTYGFNANLEYKVTDKTFLSFSLTIVDSNNPYSIYSPHCYNPTTPLYGHSVNSFNRGFYNGLGW